MALTSDEIGNLTLSEVEAIATRFAAAVKTIRDAQQLLVGGPMFSPASVPAEVLQPRLVRPTTKGLELTSDEIAQREAVLQRVRGPATAEPEFPASISAALGGQS